jgi:two-component sensor histidine kinase
VILDRIFKLAQPVRATPIWIRYGMATAIVLLAFVLRLATAPAMNGYPFLLFFPAIVIVSIAFDRWTGAYAVALSAALAWYFFVPIQRSFRLESWDAAVPLLLYVIIALFIALIIEALRRTAQRLKTTKGELEKAVELNRLLLMDVNHRVKNHLTSATALLRLTLREASVPDPKMVIEDAARRIDVLAKVYDRLHLGERTTVVSAREFITGLCDDLRDGVIGDRPVSLKVTADDADLGSNQAVPVGLVVNELVENAIKYAFPADRPGAIEIRFECQQGRCVLTVADNGVGYDPQSARKGGGARLIGAFAQQLGAQIDRDGPPGTLVRLRFKLSSDDALSP